MGKGLAGLTVVACLGLAASPAQSAIFSLSETGFSEGAEISGFFIGSDLDSDGFISHGIDAISPPFSQELSAFEISFSGNTTVGAFTLGFSDLISFVFEVPVPFDPSTDLPDDLGDDTATASADNEGIFAQNSFFRFEVGPGPNIICDGTNQCGKVSALSGGQVTANDTTIEPVVVNEIPVPMPALLLLTGLAGLGFAARRRA